MGPIEKKEVQTDEIVSALDTQDFDIRGNVIKSIRIKLCLTGKPTKTRIVRAGAGKAFSKRGIAQMLLILCEKSQKEYPDYDFRLVVLSDREFNIVGEKVVNK